MKQQQRYTLTLAARLARYKASERNERELRTDELDLLSWPVDTLERPVGSEWAYEPIEEES